MHACVGWQRLPRQITTTQSRATPRQGTTRRKGGLGRRGARCVRVTDGAARRGTMWAHVRDAQTTVSCADRATRERKGTCDAPWRAPDSHKGLGAIAGVFAEPPGTDREGARGPERGWRRRDHTTFIARGHDLRLNRGVLWHQSQGQPNAWGLGTGQVGDHGVRGVCIAKGRCRGTGRELRARDGDEGNV